MLLADVLDQAAIAYGDDVAIHAPHRTLSFVRLRDEVARAASALATLAGPGERVAVLSENRVEYFELLFAVPAAGMVLAHINYRLSAPEVAAILRDCEPAVVVVESRLESLIDALPESVRKVIVLGSDEQAWDDFLTGAGQSAVPAANPDDVAWLVYTSGTTGRPKGVMITHASVLASSLSWAHDVRPTREDVLLHPFPYCHIAVFIVFGYLLRGSSIVVRRRFEPEEFMTTVDELRVTCTALAPTMMSMLLRHPKIDEFDLSSLRLINYGASTITQELLAAALRRFQNVEFGQGYGQSEASGNVLYLDHSFHLRALRGEHHLLTATGRRMTLSSVRIVRDDLTDVRVGEVGEIVVKGDQVMRGYWRNPESTAQTVTDGWLRTGDLAKVDAEGVVYVVDRKKDMIVTGGENVYCREVEDVLARHPRVGDVAVFGLPDQHWGEIVVAAVVPSGTDLPDPAELISHCRERLGGYKVPRQVRVVDDLPKNASGKVLKRKLAHWMSDEARPAIRT